MKRFLSCLMISVLVLPVFVLTAGAQGDDWRALYVNALSGDGLQSAELALLADLNFDGTPELVYASGNRIVAETVRGGGNAPIAAFGAPSAVTSLNASLLRVKKGGFTWQLDFECALNNHTGMMEIVKSGVGVSSNASFETAKGPSGTVWYAKGRRVSEAQYQKQLKAFNASRVHMNRSAPVTKAGQSAYRQFDPLAAAYDAQGALPFVGIKSVKLSKKKLTLMYGGEFLLKATLSPGPAYAALPIAWSSSDPSVALVDQLGTVSAVGYGGVAVITAQAGGKKASATVTVNRPKAQSVLIETVPLDLAAGDTLKLNAAVLPAAADQSVSWTTSDSRVATVAPDGLVTARKMGKVEITATANGKRAHLVLMIGSGGAAPSTGSVRRRAVLIAGSDAPEDGSMLGDSYVFGHQALAARNAFAQSTFGGSGGIETVSFIFNQKSGKDILLSLKNALREADDDDVSYVYISCHGAEPAADSDKYFMLMGTDYKGGTGWVEAGELRDALDQVRGKIVVMTECCYGGRVIGKNASLAAAEAFLNAFAKKRVSSKTGELATEKYQVLCAASQDQLSFFSYYDEVQYPGLQNWYGAGFFTTALGEATGWDVWKGAATRWYGDKNSDGKLTLHELLTYTRARVFEIYTQMGVHYDDGQGSAGGMQQVVCWPENSQYVVFEK